MTFYVGQRVVAVSAPDFNEELVGESGEVLEISGDSSLPILVRFDSDREGYSWWCEESSLSCVFVGPPIPTHIVVEQKCKKLWNDSNFVLSNPKLAY